MTKIKWLLLSMLVAGLVFVSCSEDEESVNEAEVLVEYLESTDSPLMKDFVSTDMPAIIKAPDLLVLNATSGALIIDIRKPDDFALGAIPNAENVTLGNILSYVEAADMTGIQKIVVVCYTGQTAGYATTILRLMGHENAYSLKWGMCSWHTDFAEKWSGAIANTYSTQFTTDVTEKNAAGNLPALSTGETTGQEILEARIATILSEGFDPVKVTAAAVFENPSNYYIVNYWSASHYADPGHIPGAIQYTPKESMQLAESLKTLPTDKTIAVYCYTGQTSAFLSAYLRLLGYDAKSILYGTNSMIYDAMVAKEMTIYDASQTMDYDYE